MLEIVTVLYLNPSVLNTFLVVIEIHINAIIRVAPIHEEPCVPFYNFDLYFEYN